jgi:hypothetical protein
VLAILGINMLLALTSRHLTLFEKHHTRSHEARTLAHRLFLAQVRPAEAHGHWSMLCTCSTYSLLPVLLISVGVLAMLLHISKAGRLLHCMLMLDKDCVQQAQH